MTHGHQSTSTDQAEFNGIIVGLRAARLHRWPALDAVGALDNFVSACYERIHTSFGFVRTSGGLRTELKCGTIPT
jgi:hypothetical protein